MTKVEALAALEAATAIGRCSRQLVPIVEQSAKFLLNLRQEGLYTAGTATKTTGSPTVAADTEDKFSVKL